MSIPVLCECGRPFEAPEANAGRFIPCPHCGRVSTVSKPKPPPDENFLPWEPGSTATSGKAIASVALGCLFFFACLSGVPAILLGRQALSDIQRSGGRLRGRGMAITGIALGVIGCLFTLVLLMMPAVRSAGEAARRAQCTNNLKQIGIALHNYHDAHGCLPPAAITDEDGRPLLSWRVAILPYLESGDLYEGFRLDEPWDSSHNLALLDEMPIVFTCPSDPTWRSKSKPRSEPGTTNYQVPIGPAWAFTPDFRPLTFEDFTDGTASTILVGESRRLVPWTKPDDLAFDLALPLSDLGSHHGYHNNGFNALFADGTVRFLKSSINPRVLDALLTRNGNEEISPEMF